MGGQITYRLFQDRDLPGLLRLWEEESGWGTITEEQWRGWYLDTPHGECLVAVAIDEWGEVCGQAVFTPSRVAVGAREVGALRVSAPILRKELRQSSLSLNHPFIGLYKAGEEAALERGYGVLYGLPEHAWIPFFRWIARISDWLPRVISYAGVRRNWLPRIAEYQCFELPLTAGMAEGGPTLAARPASDFGEEYEALWREARETFPIDCGVVRHGEWLRFKNGGRIALEVRDARGDRLVGYAAFKKRSGLLLDLLARRPEDLAPVLRAATRWLAAEHNPRANGEAIRAVKAMETPALSPALQVLGFVPVDYKFAFISDSLDASLSAAITPERWYVMPGD